MGSPGTLYYINSQNKCIHTIYFIPNKVSLYVETKGEEVILYVEYSMNALCIKLKPTRMLYSFFVKL